MHFITLESKSKMPEHGYIYTIILLKSVCRRSRTAGRNSCSIDSGDVSNCSYRLKVDPVMSSHLSSAPKKFYTRKTSKISGKSGGQRMCLYLNDPATGYECQWNKLSRLGAQRLALTCTATAVCVCSRMHVHACVRMRDVFAI